MNDIMKKPLSVEVLQKLVEENLRGTNNASNEINPNHIQQVERTTFDDLN